MKALLLDAPGKPAALHLGEVDESSPGPGEVRVRVRACGLNPVDVDAVGEGVDNLEIGDRVVFHGDLRHCADNLLVQIC